MNIVVYLHIVFGRLLESFQHGIYKHSFQECRYMCVHNHYRLNCIHLYLE